MMRHAPFALLSIPLIAGCAGGAKDFPSLAPRAIEHRSDAIEGPAPTASVAADPALVAGIARAMAQAAAAHTAFGKTVTTAEPVVVRGARAGTGTDAWAEAQTAASSVVAARSALQDAAAALDTLRQSRGDLSETDRVALDGAMQQIDALAAQEDQATTALLSRLPS